MKPAKRDSSIEFLHDNEFGNLSIKIDKRDPVPLLQNYPVLQSLSRQFYFVVKMNQIGDRCKVKFNFEKIKKELEHNLYR